MVCGLAFDRPAMGSDFVAGHRLRAVLFLELQSPLAAPLAPLAALLWADDAEIVEFEDADDDSELREDEEFVLWATFRGCRSNLLISSVFIEPPRPLAAPFGPAHPFMVWKLGG